jgi:hypothetical protein
MRPSTVVSSGVAALVLTGCGIFPVDDFGPTLHVRNTSTESYYVQANVNSLQQLVVAPPSAFAQVASVRPGDEIRVLDLDCLEIASAIVPEADLFVLLTINVDGTIELREMLESELPESPNPIQLSESDACAFPSGRQ